MKIIDKTPFQDVNGNINIIARVQGTLKYGLNWYPELEAQRKVIPQLDRLLEKGYVLIRNFTLPESDIVIPLVLISSSSVSVILVSPVKGQFEAKGQEWNTIVNNGESIPARRNLIDLIAKLSRAFQKYLEIQKIYLPVPVEPVLIVSDPGAQVESLRPLVRVVRSDAVKQFASTLMQARPVLRTDTIYALGDRIVDPKAKPEEAPETDAVTENPVSRAQAIFNAGETDKSFDPNELGFEFNEAGGAPVQPKAAPQPKKRMGMTNKQLILLVGMFIIECCVIAAGAGIIFFFSQ